MTTLRWGILGPGRIAPRLVRALAQNDRGSLVAVASRDRDRASAFGAIHGIPQAFGSYEELLASPDVEVVYVSLPTDLHAPWTIRALEAGKHVLCEKPIALTVADVDAIAEAGVRAGRLAVEAFMYLHHPQTLRAVALAQDGALGRLELVHGSFSFYLTYPGDPRYATLHSRTIVRFFAGPVTPSAPSGFCQASPRPTDARPASRTPVTPSGGRASAASAISPAVSECTQNGERGTQSILQDGPFVRRFDIGVVAARPYFGGWGRWSRIQSRSSSGSGW